jgi:adenosylhomocysteine nucleosidase
MSELPPLLVIMALPVESQGVFEREGVPVLYTGVGKINAAWALTRKLSEYRHANQAMPLVINFGTAGSRSFSAHTLVACHSFVQHDMDVTGLGFARGTTPFDDTPARIEFDPTFTDLPQAICASGDSFQTGECALACDVVDMEAYALAKVCRLEQAQFACVKYVTDGADDSSGSDWQDNLHRAADQFLRCYRELATRRDERSK